MEAQSDRMGEGATGVTCDHSTIGADPSTVVLYPCCHSYYRGDKRLTSVTQVLKVLPYDYIGVDEARVENARDRGEEVDRLACAYVVGQLSAIPAGTREDAADLFERLFMPWWDKQGFRKVEVQKIVTDGEIAGSCDIKADGVIIDVKSTYDLLPKHRLQVAGYGDLENDGSDTILLHLSKRLKAAKVVGVSLSDRHDWRTVRQFWELSQRIAPRKESA